jgi:hypothetical protein
MLQRLLVAWQKQKSYWFRYKKDCEIFCYLKDKEITWHFQLRIEQRGGRVFVGWNGGNIYAEDDMNQKEKRRTPTWYFSCRF